MIIVRFFFNLVFWLGLRALFIFFALLSMPFSGLARGREAFYAWVRWALRGLFLLTLVWVRVEGKEMLLPPRRRIFVCNRPRRYFPLYLIAYFPLSLRFLVDEVILRFPIVGRVFRALACIPYPDEERGKEAAGAFAGTLFSALRSGDQVLVFYENLRGKSRKRGERRRRLAEIARACEAEIVPLAVTTSGPGNGRNRDIFLLGKVRIEVRDPIPISEAGGAEAFSEQISSIFEPLKEGDEEF